MHSALHLGDKSLVTVQLKHLFNALWTDCMAVDMSQVAIIVSETTRQTVRLVLDIVEFRYNVGKGPINYTSPRVPNCYLSICVSISAKASLRIEDRRVLEIVPVERPIPVYEFSSIAALLTQGVVVDVQEVPMPR